MSKNMTKRSLAIVILVFVVVLGSISWMFYINLKKQENITVEAMVKLVGNNYIIVEDEDGEEYSLKTKLDYNVGDRVSFVIKDIKKDSYPKEGTVLRIDTVSKSVQFSIEDSKKDDIVDDQVDVKDNVSENTNEDEVYDEQVVSSGTEVDVVSYFESLDNSFATYSQDKSIGESLKSGFVTVVDFLFYDGEIKGKTFDELSTTAKLKVLKLAFSIDEKIEKYFPGYKEEISTTSKKVYTNVKSKATELYLNVTTKVCESNPDTCAAAKEGLSDLKSSFSLTWDFIKEISGVGLSKLKAWYEVWKEA